MGDEARVALVAAAQAMVLRGVTGKRVHCVIRAMNEAGRVEEGHDGAQDAHW